MEAGKKRIWVRGQYVEVTDEVYMAYTQFAANMLRSRMKCIWPIRKATERCVTLRTI